LAKYTFLGEISPFFQIKVLQKKNILLQKFPVSRKQKNSPPKRRKTQLKHSPKIANNMKGYLKIFYFYILNIAKFG
jgi:hypothetical protein